MPLDSVAVGANQRQILVQGDPISAANQQNIVSAPGDGKLLGGLFAGLEVCVPVLMNAAGSLDIQRSAVGSVGIAAVSTEGVKATYSSGFTYTPYAVATDFVTLVGSGTKLIRITRIAVSGFATAAISVDLVLIKRTAANTAGTLAQPAIAQHDSNDAAPAAVVNTYSVIPGSLGAGVITRVAKLNLGATGAAGLIVWDFGTRNGRGLVLRGIAQCLSLNWNGAAVPAGTLLDIDVEWTEE